MALGLFVQCLDEVRGRPIVSSRLLKTRHKNYVLLTSLYRNIVLRCFVNKLFLLQHLESVKMGSRKNQRNRLTFFRVAPNIALAINFKFRTLDLTNIRSLSMKWPILEKFALKFAQTRNLKYAINQKLINQVWPLLNKILQLLIISK